MEKKLVSIIVPFYKTPEKNFKICINSLISQTYNNIEILVINDGSGAEWINFLNNIAKMDNRIKIIHRKNNMGLSATRNYGLTKCKGQEVIFVDSDDMLSQDAIDLMMSAKASTGAELIIGELCVINSYDIHDTSINNGEYEVYKCIDALEKMIVNDGFGSTACGRLASKNIWIQGEAPFIEGLLHEDLASTWKIIERSNTVCWLRGNLYFYYQGGHSEIHTKYVSEKFCNDYIWALEYRNNGIIEKYKELKKAVAFSYLLNCPLIYMYAYSINEKKAADKFKKAAFNLFLENYRIGMSYSYINFKQKVKILMFKFSPMLYCLTYKIKRKVKGLRN